MIAALEYVARYAVAITVKQHTTENVAEFLMKPVVLKFGPFRELLTDGAPEFIGKSWSSFCKRSMSILCQT